jgi:hypothetical protein
MDYQDLEQFKTWLIKIQSMLYYFYIGYIIANQFFVVWSVYDVAMVIELDHQLLYWNLNFEINCKIYEESLFGSSYVFVSINSYVKNINFNLEN